MDQSEFVAAVDTLTAAVSKLSARMDTQQAVVDAIKKQGRDLHSTRMVLTAAIFGLVLDLALTVGFGYLYHELDTVQRRTDTQILCPLYEFFAVSLKANPPAPGATPEQLQLRTSAADTVTSGLTTLGCDQVTAQPK
jgi:hypothetical protein